MNHALTPLQPWTADLSVSSPENTCSVKSDFIKELQKNPAVKMFMVECLLTMFL